MTAKELTMTTPIPRSEHPNPQMKRDTWLNLNGEWDFDFDFNNSGLEKGWNHNPPLSKKINVPFCPESRMSGIAFTEFIPCCWYRRTLVIDQEELNGLVYLHFGAVDYSARIFVNGAKAGVHDGGYASFKLDITTLLHEGENELVVQVIDDIRSHTQPAGKQSDKLESYGCSYNRTTGIWQTVWLEFTPTEHIDTIRLTPNLTDNSILVTVSTIGNGTVKMSASYQGTDCGQAETETSGGRTAAIIRLTESHPWTVGKGGLYDLTITFNNDTVHTYFGLRSIEVSGEDFLINGQRIFQRLVLDQGFYPDGIYTAPTANDLEKDILLAQSAGFNGARLHEKAFEPLYLYYCDLHGYLAWGEMANWCLDITSSTGLENMLPEWAEILQRDINHPSIIGWCPFNETWDFNGRRQDDRVLDIVYRTTKAIDPSRPCIDTSGLFHVNTDIYDVHDYAQDIEQFASHFNQLPNKAIDPTYEEPFPERQQYHGGIPFFVSEYGGIKWVPEPQRPNKYSWGYGEAAKTEQEFLHRYAGLTESLLSNPRMFGFCYTQLYDVEQECNGLYSYDRKPKVDINAIRLINEKIAAYEAIRPVADR